ncbi:MAG: HAD hydrolase-like protein [Endozoicomonadaceae bacterium]|nr:HAD hydrolase-like protein [Endozoicomonadaceae bacterium]
MIDTIFFDLDGTLIDLYFEDQFWMKKLPQYYAQKNNISFNAAQAFIQVKMTRLAGSLNWYCIDYWNHYLNCNILEAATDLLSLLVFRPQAKNLLLYLKKMKYQTAIITNAHPNNFNLKDHYLHLTPYVDWVVSSHQLGFPKEQPVFWKQLNALYPFNSNTTLFIDDTLTVLRSAKQHGIQHLRWIPNPSSQRAMQKNTEFIPLSTFNSLLQELKMAQ